VPADSEERSEMTRPHRQQAISELALIGTAIGSAVAAVIVTYVATRHATKEEGVDEHELNYWNRALAAMLDVSLQMLQLPLEMRARVRVHDRVTDDDALWFATAASAAVVDLGRAHSVMVLCADTALLTAATAVFNAAEAVQALDTSAFGSSLTDAELELRATRQLMLGKIDAL